MVITFLPVSDNDGSDTSKTAKAKIMGKTIILVDEEPYSSYVSTL
jgi:hypothetical protein